MNVAVKRLAPAIEAKQPTRAFLFLQGPPGPLFRDVGEAIARRGFQVYRINLNNGDVHDWPDATAAFRDRYSVWPVFFDKFLREHRITDLVLFGDCRPYHVSAHGLASIRNVRIHVLEEGYLRPHWMTLERDGVNARSTLSRDKNWFRKEAQSLSAEPELRPITFSFRRRARDSYWYYHRVFVGGSAFRITSRTGRVRFCTKALAGFGSSRGRNVSGSGRKKSSGH